MGTWLVIAVASGALVLAVGYLLKRGAAARPPDVDVDTRILRFWFWFGTNAKKIRVDGIGAFAAEIGARLAHIHPALVWEIAPRSEDFANWDFVVSADGRFELFPLVESVTDAAPDVPGFEILAFRQPGPDGLSIETPAGKLESDDVWFGTTASDGQLDLTLYVPDRALAGAAVILLDNCVGEYDAVTRVRELDCQTLPQAPEDEGLRPLPELREVLADLKAGDH